MTRQEILERAFSDRKIKPARELLRDILNMAKEKGYCYISAGYFAKKYDISERTFFRWKRLLVDGGYIQEEKYFKVNIVQDLDKNVSKDDKTQDKNVVATDKNVVATDKNVVATDKNVVHKNKENKENKENSASFDEMYSIIAFFTQQLEYNNLPVPSKGLEVKPFASLLRIDKKSKEEVKAVIEAALADPFWQGNIRSGHSLRKHYDTLLIKLRDKIKIKGSFEFDVIPVKKAADYEFK